MDSVKPTVAVMAAPMIIMSIVTEEWTARCAYPADNSADLSVRASHQPIELQLIDYLGLGLRLRLGLGLGGGLLPTTLHSSFYSRVGQIAIFSHCQPYDWADTHQAQPFFPIPQSSSPCTVSLTYRGLVEIEMVLIPDAH